MTGVPVLTFVSCRSESLYEWQDRRDTSEYSFAVRFLNLTFAIGVRGRTGANVKFTALVSRS